MQYVQPPLSFHCHPYSCVTCRYHRVEFGFIKNPPVSCHWRLFKPERLSAPDKKKSCSYWNLNRDRPVSSLLACSLAGWLACFIARWLLLALSLASLLACLLASSLACLFPPSFLPSFLPCLLDRSLARLLPCLLARSFTTLLGDFTSECCVDYVKFFCSLTTWNLVERHRRF
jgi:hypothetical protein